MKFIMIEKMNKIKSTASQPTIDKLTGEYGFDNLMLKTLYHLTDEEFDDYLKGTNRCLNDCEDQRYFEKSIIGNGCSLDSILYEWAGKSVRVCCHDRRGQAFTVAPMYLAYSAQWDK